MGRAFDRSMVALGFGGDGLLPGESSEKTWEFQVPSRKKTIEQRSKPECKNHMIRLNCKTVA